MFQLTILTIDKKVFQGAVSSLIAPGLLGNFEVLKDHAAIISPLQAGKLTIVTADGKRNVLAISGGTIEVNRNNVILLGDAIEAKEEIDIARAKAAFERAYKRLESPDTSIDQHRAVQAFLRAKNRLQISDEHHKIGNIPMPTESGSQESGAGQ